MVTINVERLARAVCGLLLLLVFEFLAYGFMFIASTTEHTWEKIFAVFMVMLFVAFAIVIFY